MLHNLFLLDMSMFNDLIIKNDYVKKKKILHCFYGGNSTASRPSLDELREYKGGLFTAKFSVDFIVTANLIF